MNLYLLLPLGFVTGAFGARVSFGWLFLKIDPALDTRPARRYLVTSTAVAVAMVFWVLIYPWL